MLSSSFQEVAVSVSSSQASRSFSSTIVMQIIFDSHESIRDGCATSSRSRCHASCQWFSARWSFSSIWVCFSILTGVPSAIHCRILRRLSCNSSGCFWSSRMSALLGRFDDDLDRSQPIIHDRHSAQTRAREKKKGTYVDKTADDISIYLTRSARSRVTSVHVMPFLFLQTDFLRWINGSSIFIVLSFSFPCLVSLSLVVFPSSLFGEVVAQPFVQKISFSHPSIYF